MAGPFDRKVRLRSGGQQGPQTLRRLRHIRTGQLQHQLGQTRLARLRHPQQIVGQPDRQTRLHDPLRVGGQLNIQGHNLADWAGQPDGAAERVATTLALAMKAAALHCARQGCQQPKMMRNNRAQTQARY